MRGKQIPKFPNQGKTQVFNQPFGNKARGFAQRLLLRLSLETQSLRCAFRIKTLRLMGAKIGCHCRIGKIHCPFPELLELGDFCEVEDGVRFRSGGAWMSAPISIGRRSFIGCGTQINVGSPFIVGSNCLIAPGCIFSDVLHHFGNPELPIREQGATYESIHVGDGAWIGSGSIVLKGVEVGNGSIVGAGSVVNRSISAYEVWAGTPAKFIKKTIQSPFHN